MVNLNLCNNRWRPSQANSLRPWPRDLPTGKEAKVATTISQVQKFKFYNFRGLALALAPIWSAVWRQAQGLTLITINLYTKSYNYNSREYKAPNLVWESKKIMRKGPCSNQDQVRCCNRFYLYKGAYNPDIGPQSKKSPFYSFGGKYGGDKG